MEALPMVTQIFHAVQPYLVRSLMAAEKIDVVLIRVRLWDFKQFAKLEEMPMIIFLSGGKDKLTNKPGTSVQYSIREPYNLIDLKQLMEHVNKEKRTELPGYFFLRYDGRFHKTNFSDIELIERKQGNYVQFYLTHGSWLLPGTLPSWLCKLPTEQFTRVSDTLIVPISEMQKITGDEFEYKGRTIKLTFRFASPANREMQNWPDGL
ncbi:MAG: LytTR family transcriptional regulator DNA-binding domain-containing protein [Bacteroidota bacterium]